jgi:4-carboxymuconolactone decarboxylase
MSRPPAPPNPDDFPVHEREELSNLLGRFKGEMPEGYFGVLANSPPLGWRLASAGRAFRMRGNHEGTYSHKDREFVDQILMQDFGTNAFRRLHTNDALSAGVRIEAIEAIREGREDEVLDDDEKLLARFIRGVLNRNLDEPTWDAMEERLGKRGVIEYAMFIAFLQLIVTLYHAFGLPEDAEEEIEDVIRRFKAGEELPSHLPMTF